MVSVSRNPDRYSDSHQWRFTLHFLAGDIAIMRPGHHNSRQFVEKSVAGLNFLAKRMSRPGRDMYNLRVEGDSHAASVWP
jgi:hypothetical protein